MPGATAGRALYADYAEYDDDRPPSAGVSTRCTTREPYDSSEAVLRKNYAFSENEL